MIKKYELVNTLVPKYTDIPWNPQFVLETLTDLETEGGSSLVTRTCTGFENIAKTRAN